MMKKLTTTCLIAVCFVLLGVGQTSLSLKADEKNKYELYVDGVKVEGEDKIIVDESDVIWIPFRTVFEAMGSEIIWEECTAEDQIEYGIVKENSRWEIQGVAYFEYGGRELVCELWRDVYNSDVPAPYIAVGEEKNKTSSYAKDFIPFTTLSSLGVCEVINDRIYVPDYHAEYLFRGLEGSMEIDIESRKVKITQSGKDLPSSFIEDAYMKVVQESLHKYDY